eukprot:scaffold14978_cov106-Skeletonema_dohrnii-CCMP3373.AAC.5
MQEKIDAETLACISSATSTVALRHEREIRYDRQQRNLRPSQMASSGHLRRCRTPMHPNNA